MGGGTGVADIILSPVGATHNFFLNRIAESEWFDLCVFSVCVFRFRKLLKTDAVFFKPLSVWF